MEPPSRKTFEQKPQLQKVYIRKIVAFLEQMLETELHYISLRFF